MNRRPDWPRAARDGTLAWSPPDEAEPMVEFAPLARGVRGRCPNCGRARILRGLWEIADTCPSCHYGYVREDGYWVGAMTVLMAMIILGFFMTFAVGVALTWPDVPWTVMTIVTFVVNGLIAVLGYSRSKTIWAGLDLAFTPASVAEQAEMEARRAVADGREADPGA